MAATGFLFILAGTQAGRQARMAVVSRLIYEMVRWRVRHALTSGVETLVDAKKEAKQRRVCGETRTGICRGKNMRFVGWNYVPRGAKGEIDLVGYDGDPLAFVEVRNANGG